MQLEFLPGLLTLLAIPLLILIHSLRHRPVKKAVTSLFIWEAVVKEEKSTIYLDALLKNVSLLLQILVIVLLALALSHPAIFVEKAGPEKQIIVLDTSASMKTRTDTGNRFDAAQQKARHLVAAMSDTDSAMIIDAGATPAIVQGFTRDKSRLVQAVDKMAPADARADLGKAVFLALSFVAENRGSRIFLITDGAGTDLASLQEMHPGLKTMLIRGGENNQGIINFTFRPRPGSKQTWDMMVTLKNFSSRSVICPLIIRTGSRVVVDKKIGLDAGEGKTIFHTFEGTVGNTMTAAIRVNDDLSCDDQAVAVFKPTAKTNVFLVSQGNFFLERLLTVMENVIVTTSAQIPRAAFESIAAQNHILIFDNVAPPAKIPGNFIVINAGFPGLPMRLAETVDAPKVTDWHRQSAITANVNFDGLYIRTAKQMILADPAVAALLESKQTPLISRYYDGRTKAVMFGFDLNDSDLPLRVAYPVLMKNIFQWLHPVTVRFNATHVSAGTPFDIYVPKDATTVAVRNPSGKWEKIIRDRGVFSYEHTKRAGLYKIRVNNNSFYRAVNLFDAAESDINNVRDVGDRPGDGGKILPVELSRQAVSLWSLVFLAGILVLIMETVLWFKREESSDY